MSAKDIKYRHAFDKDGEEWCIDDVKDKSLYRSLSPWHCISCGVEMRAGLGDKNRHYFKHNAETECNGETYLHNLAKTKLKKWFESNNFIFQMVFHQTERCCEHSTCNFYDLAVCSTSISIPVSSDKWGYNICNVEETVKLDDNYFRADLIIKSSDKNIQPILIEICVHHPSTQKKIESGLQIIEIQFDSEEEIEEFCKDNKFKEGDKVKFFGFKDRPSIIKDSLACLGLKKVRRFTYKNRWHHFLEKSFNCSEMHVKAESDSEVELNLPDGTDSKWRKTALAFLWDYGYNPDPLYYGTAFRKFEYNRKNVIPVEEYVKKEKVVIEESKPKKEPSKKESENNAKIVGHSSVIPSSWPAPFQDSFVDNDNIKRGVGNYPRCPIKNDNMDDDNLLLELYSKGLGMSAPFFKNGHICKNVEAHRYIPEKKVLYVMTDHRESNALIYTIFKVIMDKEHNFVHIELECGDKDIIFPKFKSYTTKK